MSASCGCTPGTEENGWHEQRSEACVAKERAAFARAVERATAFMLARRYPAKHGSTGQGDGVNQPSADNPRVSGDGGSS